MNSDYCNEIQNIIINNKINYWGQRIFPFHTDQEIIRQRRDGMIIPSDNFVWVHNNNILYDRVATGRVHVNEKIEGGMD